ncbi:MAG: dihydropteroate synthase [Alphaproteobacteria bacterium]|nr:dihydropteroate synthase [Alphaproteobacteria bacterium]
MGILNVTPDSFSDGGLYLDADVAVARAAAMREEGADVIDIGGESTRPDAAPVPEKDELARTGAAIRAVCRDMDCPVSIDTYKAGVARAAAKAGAVLVNDVWGMTRDPEMARAVAETESAVVITYNRGAADDSISLADDMKAFFDRAFHCAKEAGIPREFVILDPGIGFSKTWRQNFEALARLDVMLDYGRPVLVGLSRKSFIGRLLNKTVGERETGTLIANIVALQRGAAMIRVHDVAAHKDALKMLDALGGQA